METNVFLGITLHAVGGIAAATCFVPQKGTTRWSYQSFWLLMVFGAWLVMPIVVAALTVPNLGSVISETPQRVIIETFLLGAVYGFGGMAFGMAIRHIGFSLTYAIAIGLSAVLGTFIPILLKPAPMQILTDKYNQAGGVLVFAGLAVSLIGVAVCGYAGLLKERESQGKSGFNFKLGAILVILAGILSAIFGVALERGAPMDKLAAAQGAGVFEANAKYIFAMGGAFVTNLIWWGIIHFRKNTWREYKTLNEKTATNKGSTLSHYFFGSLAGILWYMQFFFYGLGHVRMGEYKFISWGIHMAMLIFFSFGIGLILKEWKGLSSKTISVLLLGLLILLSSFSLITYGSYMAEQSSIDPVEASTGH